MLINDILTKAGFIENETFKQTCFKYPPKNDYCIYIDDVFSHGDDKKIRISEHNITFELYSRTPPTESEKKIESALKFYSSNFLNGYKKQSRMWLETEQLYQTVYEFDFIIKEEN